MLTAFREMWAGLNATGKTAVLVVLILAITGLLAMAMAGLSAGLAAGHHRQVVGQ